MKKLTAILMGILLVILVFPTAALAFDFEGSTYNDNDFNKLQAFLDTMSDDGVHTNGTRLNPAYESNKPTTWGMGAAILWSSDASNKRITQLSLSISGLKGSLDLSGFTSLTYVGIRDNLITDVNLSGDTAITYLDVRRTLITELDASGLTALNWLTCDECPNLTDVDVSGCTALETLFASGSAADSTDIGKLDTLDVSGCTALEDLSVEKNRLTALDLGGLSSLTDLDIDNNRLTTLDVSGCASLESLDVSYNSFASLDVSKCAALKRLSCMVNQTLSTLTIKGASSLEEVDCSGCHLTALDASGLTNLTDLNCNVNYIETLDVTGDAALESLQCHINELESLSVAGLNNLGMLDCSNNSIMRIEGLSDAVHLQLFGCSDNKIEELDVSGLQYLVYLVCDNNELTSLDVSGDTGLFIVMCSGNRLTTLDLSDSTILGFLLATDNRLISIKAVIMAQPVTLTANGGGYVELYAYDEYYANAVPCTGESFLGWTESDTEAATTVRYDLTVSTPYDLTANFTALELESDNSDGKIYTGGRITLTPNHTGGTWVFDESFLSRDGDTFTALKAGTTRVTYTWEDETVTYDVTITASGLPETGQDFTWVYIAAGGAVLVLAAALLLRKRAARGK